MTAPVSNVVTAAQQLAADEMADQLGEARGSVGVLDTAWLDRLRNGVLIDLSIGRWRAHTTLSAEDLGVRPRSNEERRAWSELVQLGSRLLLPRNEMAVFDRIESKARAVLDGSPSSRGIKTFLGSFVPASAYEATKRELLLLQADYFRAADNLIARWDEVQNIVAAQYAVLAAENYARLLAAGVPVGDQQEAIETFVKRVMAEVPSADKVRASFTFSWSLSYVPVGSWLQDDADTDKARAEMLAAYDQRTQMERDVLAQAQQGAQRLQRVVADLESDLRTRLYDLCADVLASMRKNGGVPASGSIAQIRRRVELVKQLQFFPDAQLDRQLADLELLLDVPTEERRGEPMEQLLQGIAAEVRLALLELDRPPERSARELGVPDAGPELELVAGRRRGGAGVIAVGDVLGDLSPARTRPVAAATGPDAALAADLALA